MKNSFLLFLLLLSTFVFGQNVLKVPVDGNGNQVKVVNLQDAGVFILNKTERDILDIKKVDSDLKLVWETQTEIPAKAELIDEFFDGKYLYLVLANSNSKGFFILKISSSFSAYKKYNFPVSRDFQYGYFAANDKVICIGGSLDNEPIVGFMDVLGSAPKFVNLGFKGVTALQSVNVQDNLIRVAIINTYKRVNKIVSRSYDYLGNLIADDNILAKDDYTFLSVKQFESANKSLLVGNYGVGKTPSSGYQSSQGIFVTDILGQSTKYYSFDEFKNLFSFLSDKQREKLKKRVEKRKDKGGEYMFDYRLYFSDLIYDGKQTLLVGEVFEPEYVTRNYYNDIYSLYARSFYWGRPLGYNYYWLNNPYYYGLRNREVFDGLRYLEGVVFAIDSDGNLRWDNSFPYKNLKYYEQANHLKVSLGEAEISAIYTNASKLNISKLSNSGEVLKSEEFESKDLDLQFESKRYEFTNFEHWYGNVYYNWGVEKEDSGKVCFIQKIVK